MDSVGLRPLEVGCLALNIKGCNLGKIVTVVAAHDPQDPEKVVTIDGKRFTVPPADWWLCKGEDLQMWDQDAGKVITQDFVQTRSDLLMRLDGLPEAEQEQIYTHA